MRSWAQTYLAGAVVGTALIVAAFVAFVPLVSLQAPQDWSVPGFGLHSAADEHSADVGGAVAVAANHDGARGTGTTSNGRSVAAALVATGTAAPPASEPRTGGAGDAVDGGSVNQTTAIAPASAEVVARDPGALTPGGGGSAPSPSATPTEAGGSPGPAVKGGEGAGVDGTATVPPIPAGVVTEEPEALPPPEAPPPPSEGSAEAGGVAEPPARDEEGEAAQPGDGDVPVGSGLEREPGAGGAEVVDRGVADPALAAPGLVDVTADR